MTACGRTLVLLNRDGDRFSLDFTGFCLHCLGSRFYSRSLAPCDRPVLHLRTVSAAARGRPGAAVAALESDGIESALRAIALLTLCSGVHADCLASHLANW